MNTIRSVQCLRAIAAAMVMFGHTASELQYFFKVSLGLWFIPWTAGVDIFFVISGFVIFLLARQPPNTEHIESSKKQAWRFLLARIIRLTPLYYLFTTLVVVVLIVTPSSLNSAQFEPWQILNSYFFIPSMRHDGQIIPVLSVGWTLNYEMFFYVLFGLGIAAAGKHAATFVALTLLSLVAIGQTLDIVSPALIFWTNPIFLEFLAGVLIAKIYLSTGIWRQRLPAWPAISIFALGIGLLITVPGIVPRVVWLPEFTSLYRIVHFGLPACLIVVSATVLMPDWLDRKCPNLMVSLGSSSYALYLSHRFTLRLFSLLWLNLTPLNNAFMPLVIIITACCCIAAAHLLHFYFERPLLKIFKKKYLPEQIQQKLNPASSSLR